MWFIENYRHSILLFLPLRDGGCLSLLPTLLILDGPAQLNLQLIVSFMSELGETSQGTTQQ